MAPALSFIVGIVGNVISIMFFASPIKTFRKVVKKKSTGEYEVVPYITTLLCTNIWMFYGFRKPGGLLIITVNAAGATLQFIYITLFLIYSPLHKKVKTVKLAIIFNIGSLGSAIAVILLLVHRNKQLAIIGIIGSGLAIIMYASPLLVMRMVIKTKSVEYMPFLLSFFMFMNAAIWTIYAVLVEDVFIMVPSVTGVVLGSAQMILYSIYRNKTKVENQVKISQKDHGAKNMIEVSSYKETLDEQEQKPANITCNRPGSPV
ncbi:SWEET sugar transporter [Corchorus capsularis]|uniref:Bidirectional sugar transporter SWEET n=1 Tax=Corchorus capsularis TaxID=210143 RepID=A0A1R3JVF7_COCAP|nr:SWEET sugar transporter [Corchorus capsularis]